MQILPIENVEGRKLVEAGQLCERKNGRGVDPNRNWDAHWGFKESDYDPAEEYPGAAPFRQETAFRLGSVHLLVRSVQKGQHKVIIKSVLVFMENGLPTGGQKSLIMIQQRSALEQPLSGKLWCSVQMHRNLFFQLWHDTAC